MMRLIEESNQSVDTEERIALLQQLDARMRETFAPQIAIDQMQACYPINYGVTGLQLYGDGYINARYVDWDPSLQQAQ